MTARLALVRGRVLPNGWADLLRQCSLFGLAYLLYRLVEGLVATDSSVAFAHARELISLERSLHVFVEPQIQAWATSSHLLMVIATYVYINAQTTILIALLFYLYIAHNRNYYFVRNMLFVGLAIGLIGYGLFPTMPPRFIPEWGFIDTIQQVTGVSGNSTIAGFFFNPYAAMPSMHVACAVMLGWSFRRLVRSRIAKVAWTLWPLFITFMTVITGNHFLIDAVAGLFVAVVSFFAARAMAALRPHAWTFRVPAPVSSAATPQGSPVPA
ncbi:MAG TPA: phosphatase PAP2 family protein [Solirubrobacteraceae bacterium]|nr:phosphatase PAP2 family protein [Solirubrobacteraceae bacterium]